MNYKSNFFINQKLFLFLIILIVGFVFIGSSFAANVDDSSILNDVSSDGSLQISATNANVSTDMLVNDVDSNNHLENSSSPKKISKTLNLSKSQFAIKPMYAVYSADDFKNAFRYDCSKIILASDITVNKTIEISKDNIIIDGKGHTIKTCAKSSDKIFSVSHSNCIICNCIFNNSANKHCSAIYSIMYSTMDIINCTFNRFNNSYTSPAICMGSFSHNKVINCTFNNCSGGRGGAIYVGSHYSEVVDCNFNNCSAIMGGAIYLWGHKSYVYNGIFHNVTTYGTVYPKGVVIFSYYLDNVIRDSTFYVKQDNDLIYWDQPWYYVCGFSAFKSGVEENCHYLG